jgi:hypothetical protein
MATRKSGQTKHQLLESGGQALEAAQAKIAGKNFKWYFGRVNALGHYEIAGGRSVSIVWEGGGVTSKQGDISDEQWEIFKLAFTTSGRIATLSDMSGDDALHDFRFVEVIR